ncbi:hypothetical protein CUN63_02500 [Pseudomonas sp. ACM7]|nr:hypothetical protein CUN63_02500 [Pseudomonas sp. ACM7]
MVIKSWGNWLIGELLLVGAGLLAKAVRQTTSMLNVSQHSRASPLPQWIAVWFRFPTLPFPATPRRSPPRPRASRPG